MLWMFLMLMFCLRTVESEECKNTGIIVGRLGKEVDLNFPLSDLRDEYSKYIFKRYGRKIIQSEIQIQDLFERSVIRFKNKMDSRIYTATYIGGVPAYFTNGLKQIFLTNDDIMIEKRQLQKSDVGIYWIEFESSTLVQKTLIIPDKPTITGRSPPNPVLKPEDNYSSIIQLECHSVSTSIGECIFTYTVWYKNGMRITDVDPTLSQINLTVDHNGGTFTCLATDYPPCYQRLQTTKHYDVLNIEECNNVFESKTFILQPKYPPVDVKLQPGHRNITVIKGEDLKVRCSAKCHPICDVTWKKDFQHQKLSGLIYITKNIIENDLVIENVNSSHEGYYGCLVNNIHGEVIKGFTLSVREAENRVNIVVIVYAITITVVFTVTVLVVLLIGILVMKYKKYQKKKNEPNYIEVPDGNLSGDGDIFETMDLCQNVYENMDELLPENMIDENIYESMDLPGAFRNNNSRNGEPGTSTDNNSRNGEPGTSTDNNSRNGEPGTSRDNNSRNGEPETSRDNNSRNGEPGTSRDHNSRNGEPETSTDNNSRNGQPETPTDNNSRNGEPGTSTDNNSRNGEPGTSTDNFSRNGEQNTNPENDEYDALDLKHLEDHGPERIYTRLSQNHRRYPQLFNQRKNGRKGFDS